MYDDALYAVLTLFETPECLLFQLRIAQRRLQQCLSRLGCSVMERERRSFLLYSQFYEQILQQQTQLLCQREQVRVDPNRTLTPQKYGRFDFCLHYFIPGFEKLQGCSDKRLSHRSKT